MGIDIYASWTGMTEEERVARYTGFSVTSGHLGYLREAYHGGPYATRILVPEAFDHPEDWDWDKEDWPGAEIRAVTMIERLPATVYAAIRREAEVYGNQEARAFLAEKGHETKLALNEAPEVIDLDEGAVTAIMPLIQKALAEATDPSNQPDESDTPPFMYDIEVIKDATEKFPTVRAFVAFVKLAMDKEAETGELVRVYASY